MSLPREFPDFDEPNEDDEIFAEGMVVILEQAYSDTGAESPTDVLLARLAVELAAIRVILDARLPPPDPERPAWV